jgi:hypothetical protein
MKKYVFAVPQTPLGFKWTTEPVSAYLSPSSSFSSSLSQLLVIGKDNDFE